MFKSRASTLFGLALTFSFQPVVLPVSTQSEIRFPVKNKQNLDCRSQRMLILNAIQGLLYPSDSDYPFEYFYNSQTSSMPSPQQFNQLIGQQGQQVTQVDFDDFFNQLIINQRSSGAEAGMIMRYESLRQVFKNQFTNLTVYRVGEIQVQVYITGVNSSCGMAGLKTMSIET